MTTKFKLLLVDDDPYIRKFVGLALADDRYDMTTAESGEEALDRLQKDPFDIVITDLVMSGISGMDVLREVKEKYPETPVMILTGYGEVNNAIDAMRHHADDFVLKTDPPEEIKNRVSICIEKLEMKRRLKMYEGILPICCVCKSIRDDFNLEPGTGKWMSIEAFMAKKGLRPSHSYCPKCLEKQEI